VVLPARHGPVFLAVMSAHARSHRAGSQPRATGCEARQLAAVTLHASSHSEGVALGEETSFVVLVSAPSRTS
jgi:hypothetical protein